MINLSKHFTLEELIRSEIAARKNIDNTPSETIVKELSKVAGLLEQVRALLGNHPISVSSGYRCSKLNSEVGSKPSSKHVQGLAVDFRCDNYGSPVDIVKTIQASNLMYDQCILEFHDPSNPHEGWVHIGLGRDMRCQVLTVNSHGTFPGIRV